MPLKIIFLQNSESLCLIKNLAWKNNPTTFAYKFSVNEDVKTESIDNISYFSVSDYEFERFNVDLDVSTNDMSRMSATADPEWEKRTVFLKKLVEGKSTLYYYEDGNLIRFFVTNNDQKTVQQLVYKQYVPHTYIETNTKFIGQLYDIMKEKLPDPAIYKKLKYDKASLIKLFLKYNAANGIDSKNIVASQDNAIINFKFTPGILFVSADAIRNDVPNQKMDFGSKAAIRIGAEVELLFPFNNHKWALFTDPYYFQYENTGSVANYTWKANVKFVDIPAGVRHYMYINKKSKLFLNVAYVLSLNTGSSSVAYSYISDSQTYSKAFKVKNSPYFAFGVGFSYERYSIEGRLNLKRELLPNTDYVNATLGSVGLIFGYKIF